MLHLPFGRQEPEAGSVLGRRNNRSVTEVVGPPIAEDHRVLGNWPIFGSANRDETFRGMPTFLSLTA